ncbi:hypothetical protein [uncultured Mediterranean phage uvDeep-CGR2-KM19-C37]|nr:hypothetical protein [uncultured Mediterranean phage uvDeep-CGR2-KM19-C37]
MTDTQLAAALTAVNDATPDDATPDEQLVAAKCRGLIRGYHAKWETDNPYDPFAVERVLTAPLTNINTLRDSRTFQIAGMLDVLATYNSRTVVIDHKTTSCDIAHDSPYWEQLSIEGQVSQYVLLCGLHGIVVQNAMWDVIRKPGIKPKKISKSDREAILARFEYFGQTPLEESWGYIADGNESENLELYEARLADDCTNVKPEWYFQRQLVPRIDSEVAEYAAEVWQHGKDLLYERRRGANHPRNSGACMLYGTPCKFLAVCSGHDTIDSDNWQRKEQVHSELPMLDGDGKQVLTHSRIRCFQTCRRKHYYEYELGVERRMETDTEALYFGSLMHLALNAWWRALIPEGNDDDHSNTTSTNGEHDRAAVDERTKVAV